MHAGVPRAPRFPVEPLQRVPGRIEAAERLDQGGCVVDREARSAVDARVVRAREVGGDDVAREVLELRAADATVVDERISTLRIARRKDIHPVVVGPHERELDVEAVARAEEAALKRAFEIRAVLIPVVVEHEAVHPVRTREVDVASHHCGVRLILLTAGRYPGLGMPAEARAGVAQQLPLRPTRVEACVIARVGMVLGEVVGENLRACHEDFRNAFYLTETLANP